MRCFLSKLGSFYSDRRGNIAILFGLAIIPIFGAMGAAVDYSLANASRTKLIASLDNTGLTLSKMMPLTQTQLDTNAWQIFNANAGSLPLTFSANDLIVDASTNGKIKLDLNATYSLKMATVLEYLGVAPTIPVRAHVEIQWGNSRLRVALVLDNSGSMSASNKMTALKTATSNLITQLQGVSVTPGDVYISIIPFVNAVNVGSSNYTASWLDWTDWDANNGTCSVSVSGTPTPHSSQSKKSLCTATYTCSKSGYTTQTTCLAAGTCSKSGYTTQTTCVAAGTCSKSTYTTQSTCVANGTCSKSSITTQASCISAGHTWTPYTWTAATWTPATWNQATWTPASHTTWNGCVTERGDPLSTGGAAPGITGQVGYDQKVDLPVAGNTATLFPADQGVISGGTYCPPQMMELSYNWSALQTAVTNMTPNGATNQPIGLVWGWQSLVGGGPLTYPAKDPNFLYNDVIILLSDGLNTYDRWYGDGSTTSTDVDSRMVYGSSFIGTCKNVKATGVTIYTVQVNTGGDPTSTLLQNCATDLTKFFLLTSSNQIVTTFNQIGTALANIHIAK